MLLPRNPNRRSSCAPVFFIHDDLQRKRCHATCIDVRRYTLNLNFITFRSRIAFGAAPSVSRDVAPQRLGKRRQMSIDDIADHVDVDAEILVHQDVAEISNLRPGDLRMRAGDLIGKMVHGFAGLRLTAAPPRRASKRIPGA